jgi:hypothetical protein
VLLLGCGDVRNILFTTYSDVAFSVSLQSEIAKEAVDIEQSLANSTLHVVIWKEQSSVCLPKSSGDLANVVTSSQHFSTDSSRGR